MTTPSGLPLWARASSAAQYGGDAGKTDYQTPGAVNARTDVTAAQFLRLTADLAAIARVAPIAVLRILCNDTVPAAPTVESAQLVSGVASAPYAGDAPPTGMPTVTRLGNGRFRVQLPSTLADDFAVAVAPAIRCVDGAVHGATSGTFEPSLVDNRTVDCWLFIGGVAGTDGRATVVLY